MVDDCVEDADPWPAHAKRLVRRCPRHLHIPPRDAIDARPPCHPVRAASVEKITGSLLLICTHWYMQHAPAQTAHMIRLIVVHKLYSDF